MTVSHWLRSHNFSSTDLNTDVLIIGGGFVGLSTAYWLTEYRPDLKITVLDRSLCGSGASGRNAGFLTKGSASFFKYLDHKWGTSRALEILAFAEESLSLLHQQILHSSPELKFEKSHSMTLFQKGEDKEKWAMDFDPRLFKFEWDAQEKLPASLQSKFFGGLKNGPEYKINPTQLLGTLKILLEARKVHIVEKISGFEITPEGVRTDVNFIRAKQVIMALNGYFPQFHQIFNGLITPRRAQMLSVEIDEEFDCPSLYYDPPERVYWRKASDKILLIGGKRLLEEETEVGDFDKVSPKIQNGLEDYLRDQLQLKYKVLNRWAGTMGFTESELPIITKIKAPMDTFVIGGFSGHGMGLGFRSAMEMTELVLGKKEQSFFSTFKNIEISI